MPQPSARRGAAGETDVTDVTDVTAAECAQGCSPAASAQRGHGTSNRVSERVAAARRARAAPTVLGLSTSKVFDQSSSGKPEPSPYILRSSYSLSPTSRDGSPIAFGRHVPPRRSPAPFRFASKSGTRLGARSLDLLLPRRSAAAFGMNRAAPALPFSAGAPCLRSGRPQRPPEAQRLYTTHVPKLGSSGEVRGVW